MVVNPTSTGVDDAEMIEVNTAGRTRDVLRRTFAVGAAIVLVMSACSSEPEPAATSTTRPPITTTIAPTTTGAPAIASARDVVESIEALFESSRIEFSITSSLSLGASGVETSAEGTLDNDERALGIKVEVGSQTSPALRSTLTSMGIADTRFIYSDDQGILMRLENQWMQLPADQVGQLVDELLGFPIPAGSFTLPYVGLVFDAIIEDPSQISGLRPISQQRTIDGESVAGFRFDVPGPVAAPALVASNMATVAALAPVADERVEVSWWLDSIGRVRVVEINGDAIAAQVYGELARAFPDSGVESISDAIDGASVSLNVPDADGAGPIEFPNPAQVEVLDLSRGLQQPIVAPGTCVASYQAALLPSNDSILDCSEPHRGEIFAVFDIPDSDTYPGEDPVFGYGSELCFDQAAAYTDLDPELFVLYPTLATWVLGDRRIICVFDFADAMQESVARAPLDRVGSFHLVAGQCLPLDVDIDQSPLPLVDCARPHGFEVIAVLFIGTWERDFPGADSVHDEAVAACNVELDAVDPDFEFSSFFFTPTRETWAIGDRVVTCIAESAVEVTGSLVGS